MAEYIEHEATYELARTNECYSDFRRSMADLTSLKELLDDIPTVDVVEVVRCKDCMWWYPREYGSVIGRCENPYNGLANEYIEEDDFCSYGKRKEGAEG